MSNTVLYIHKKCSTCKKALNFLEKQNLINTIEIKDITVTPPSLEELKKLLKFKGENIKKLFNTSGILYRKMNLKEKIATISNDEALKILSSNGMLVKRPFLLGDNFSLTGFNEPLWQITHGSTNSALKKVLIC